MVAVDISLQFFSAVAKLEKKNSREAVHSSKPLKNKKEIEIVTKATIERYHSQYVDICRWNPKNEVFVTASNDKKAFWWHCQDLTQDANSVKVVPLDLSENCSSVSCLDWSENGKLLIIGM